MVSSLGKLEKLDLITRSRLMEIIKSATVNAADLLDMSSSIGTIEGGKVYQR